MKLLLSHLKEWIDVDCTPQEIAEKLTFAGLEVDQIDQLEQGDALFEISLTPNLGHCLSVLGIARELAAQMGKRIKFPALRENEIKTAQNRMQITIQAEKQCIRYACKQVGNIRVGPSPEWLKNRLIASGIGSVNNVVDVGNYVMLSVGNPLHIFDYDKLPKKEIEVSLTTSPNQFVGLNEKSYALPLNSIVIKSGDEIIALAGIMGSESSAIQQQTQSVLIEAASFNASSIRRVSKELSLRSDSSYRFERGIDAGMIPFALEMAASLLQEVAGASTPSAIVEAGEAPVKKTITLRKTRCEKILGLPLSLSEICTLLNQLEIETIREDENEGLIRAKIPTYRGDLNHEIDLVEEVGRIYGYGNLPLKEPMYGVSRIPHTPLYLFEKKVRTLLVAEGLQEWITCALVGPKEAGLTAEKESVAAQIAVLHPCSIEQSLLRTSLLTSMLPCVKQNADFGNHTLHSFEIGSVFFKQGKGFIQQSCLGILLKGKSAPHHFSAEEREYDLLDLKGIIKNLLSALSIKGVVAETTSCTNFHPYRQGAIESGESLIGVFGQVHPDHLDAMGIEGPLYFAQINLHHLQELQKEVKSYRELSRFPGSERDWTVRVKEEVPVASFIRAIHESASSLLEKVSLKDIYRNEQKVGSGVKSLTFNLSYRQSDQTIAHETVEKEHASITNSVAKKLADCIV